MTTTPSAALPASSEKQGERRGSPVLQRAENAQPSRPRESEDGALGLSAALYVGQLEGGNFSSMFYEPWNVEFENTNLIALSAAYEIYRFSFGLGVELEAGVGRRFSGEDNWEFWTAAAVRWHDFPWNDVVKTTLGVAFFGPNYSTRISDHEASRNGGKKTHWMNFFAPEVTLAHPDFPQAALLIRLHHRSGLAGLYNDTTSGSTFLSVRTRYFF